MIPHKFFYQFESARLDATSAVGTYILNTNWLTTHEETLYFRQQQGGGGVQYEISRIFLRGRRADGWDFLPGLDKLCKVFLYMECSPPYMDEIGLTEWVIQFGSQDEPTDMSDWPDMSTICGRYYKDSVEWPTFNLGGPDANWCTLYTHIFPSDCPKTYCPICPSWDNVKDSPEALANSDEILKNGIQLKGMDYTHSESWDPGEEWAAVAKPLTCELYFFNPFCNSFSTYVGVAAGGWPMVLTGLGFNNSNADIAAGCSPFSRPGGWADEVDKIYIERPDGTVVDTLTLLGADYTVDSNTQITISAMPALPVGVYQLRLYKLSVGYDIEGWAGDWRTDDLGRVHAGERLYFYVGEVLPGPPVPVAKICFTKGDLEMCKYYAPIDTRGPEVFYEGMVLEMSNFSRGTNDLEGTPVLPDMEVTLDNTSQEFSKILAEWWVKNGLVEIFVAWGGNIEGTKTQVFKGIVADYELPHSTWNIKLLSTLDKYLEKTIPQYRCTEEDYPDIHPNHINRDKPEVLGTCEYDEGSTPGAVEAIYVDIVNFEYLAAHGTLHAVTAAYSDSNLVAPADYTVIYKDGGQTYIKFDHDQRDNKITYDAEGYSHVDWDVDMSGGAWVQNPAYIILYVIAILLGVPEPDIDLDAFDDLAAEYKADGYDEAGYLIVQDAKGGMETLGELCWTYGAKLWTTLEGKITIGRKSSDDLGYDLTLFDQIDALDQPSKPTGLDKVVNYAPLTWEYYPTANLSIGAKLVTNDASIAAFGAQIMPGSEWGFNWTTSESLVDERAAEELDKHAFGDYRLLVPVSMEHLDELEILENIAYQDPFALNAAGTGAAAKLYYTVKLTYDLMKGSIDLEAVDMSWALLRYLMLGDELALADNWEDTSAFERTFAYLADEATGLFADGEPGKMLIDETLL